MEPTFKTSEIAYDISPYLIEYKDGTIQRLAGTEWVPPGFDPQTNVTSEDIIIIPESGVSARIYRPSTTIHNRPILLYLHGGAFVIASPGLPYYHNFCNQLVQSTDIIIISLDYRRAPENPLPAAFHDSWAAIEWIAAHKPDKWIHDGIDYHRLFIAGDSAGATMTHHIACKLTDSGLGKQISVEGVILIHPFFRGKDPIGSEINDPRKGVVDGWWNYVCRSDKGCDDPFINPFSDGAPEIESVAGKRMIVLVAEEDVLKERGKYYYDGIVKSGWKGKVELFESKRKGHVFHIFDPDCDEAMELRRNLASFINGEI
ncbi:probable carboxylesterase 2 [Amaranthus tricolor]|uniref:probable carboxylesterase 2 n=1 Tax=Amaranthus tricolor TaxID=29722 RepID=UPI0025867B57|nr:probable carboxylesterase 2 [Amaranthus tricolor]